MAKQRKINRLTRPVEPRVVTPVLVLGLALCACGAPVKSAGEVAGLFAGGSLSLQDKETALCATLANRDSAPSTKSLNLDLGGCASAGLAAVEYRQVTAFVFQGLTDKGAGATAAAAASSGTTGQTADASTPPVIHKTVRAQVWLNRSLLSLAGALGGLMQQKQNAGGLVGAVTLPDSAKGSFAGLVTPSLSVVAAPTLDVQNLAFSTQLHFTLTGAVQADHTLAIDGRLFDHAFAVTIATTEDKTYQASILKNFRAVIAIIPHAEDVYLDLFVDLNVYDFGLPSLINTQLNTLLSSGLKSAVDAAMEL